MSLKISDLAALNTVTVGATGFNPKLLVEGSNTGGLAEIYVSAGSGNALRLNTNFVNGNYIDINPYINGVSNGGFSINQGTTPRFVITEAGNVGIGTTTDAGYKLNVSGTIAATSAPGSYGTIIRIRDTVVSGTESFGGIHFTSSPGTDYTIGKWSTAGGAGLLQIRDQTGSQFVTVNGAGQVGIGCSTMFDKLTLGGGKFYLSYAANQDVGGAIYSYNNSNYQTYAGGLKFQTFRNETGSYLMYDAMTIDGAGRVGIGTGSPYSPLQVGNYVGTGGYSYGTAATFVSAFNAARATLFLGSTDNTSAQNKGGSIDFGGGSEAASSPYTFARIKGYKEKANANYAGYLSFSTTPEGSDANTERMRITSTGNVGINDQNPGVRFVNSGGALSTSSSPGSATNGSDAILSANGLYGLYTGVSGAGHVWQQVQRNDGVTTLYPLSLQPIGSNVLIGTYTDNGYRLQVNGGIHTNNNSIIAGTFSFINLENNSSKLNVSRYLALQDNGSSVGIGYNSDSNPVGGKLSVNGNSYFNGTITNTGNAVFGSGANRPVTYDSNGGNFRITANPGGWATGYLFNGSSGTYRGGFGGYGDYDSLIYHWIGSDYNVPTITAMPNQGNVMIGTTTDSGYKLNVYRDADVWHTVIGGASGQLRIGGQTSSGAVIQAYTPSGTTRNIYLQRDGGNVLINTTTDSGYKLQVNGSAKLAGSTFVNQNATIGEDAGSQKRFVTIPLNGADYQHRYILLAKVPTFGNSTVNAGFRGSITMERVNGIGIDLHDEFDFTVSYGNSIQFVQTSYQAYQTSLVQLSYGGTQYLALYVYSPPGYAIAYMDVIQTNYGGWLDGNTFVAVESSSSLHSTVSYSSNATVFKQSVNAPGFFNSSDIRLKNLTDYNCNVSDIKPISYLWKDSRDNKKHIGYSAQEVQKVMPDAINEDVDGMLSVNYVEILVAKVAELEKRIKQLEK